MMVRSTQPAITMSGLQTIWPLTISFILPLKLNAEQFVLNSFPVHSNFRSIRLGT